MPHCPLAQASQLSFVMAIAVGETILPFLASPELLSYKWPNDLLIQKEKIAGILIETESQGGLLMEACVVGIGLNVNSAPDNLAYPVTALRCHTKVNLNQDVVFSALLAQIRHYYQVWQQEGFVPIREAWKQRACRLGQSMAIRAGNKDMRGQFIDISPEGALLLKEDDGRVHTFMSAEIA
ncbi:MAG: biotin--[acetyl-CoA-carboxylase] ligase [Alphaproteobacteria bacterium]|nr:biotin--[acetyl-CoA-carboxylase] ligase [Alphaproteobacteria bacterium]